MFFFSSFLFFPVSANSKFWIGLNSLADLTSSASKTFSQYLEERFTKKSISTSLFKDHINNYKTKKWGTRLQGLQTIKKNLDIQYANCNLSDEEIGAALFFINSDYAKELRNYIPENKLPSKNDEAKACSKLTACIEKKATNNMNRSCENIIHEAYLLGKQQKENELLIEEAALWKDRYQNWSLDDSSYDLLNDIESIGKILFEETTPSTQIIFYQLPKFEGGNNKIDKNNQSKNNNESKPSWADTDTQTENNNDTEESGAWTNSQEREWNKGTNNGLTEDDEINKFIKENEWLPNQNTTEESNNAFSIPCPPEWKEIGNMPPLKETKNPPYSPLEITPSEIDQIIEEKKQELENIKKTTSNKGNKKTTTKAGEGDLSGMDPQNAETTKEQLEKCVEKCKWLSIDERAICKIQCLCAEYSTPALNEGKPFKLLEEGALRVRICTIPSKVTIPDTNTKIVYSIEGILKELGSVINGLYEWWEITTRTRKKEILDTSLSQYNFAKNISFILGLESKKPTNNKNENQEKKKETEVVKNLLGKTKEENYIIMDSWTTRASKSMNRATSTPPQKADSLFSLSRELEKNHLANLNLLIDNFLENNISLLYELKENLISINNALERLWEKKE